MNLSFEQDLLSYKTTFSDEQLFVHRAHELWHNANDKAFHRLHFVPGHFTASAFVVNEARTKTLLIEHPKYHIWVQPGGHIEQGELPIEAAIREAKEETGLSKLQIVPNIFDIDIHPIPAKGNEPLHQHFDIRYLVIANEWELPKKMENIHTEWINLSAIDTYSESQSVLRLAQKLSPSKKL